MGAVDKISNHFYIFFKNLIHIRRQISVIILVYIKQISSEVRRIFKVKINNSYFI